MKRWQKVFCRRDFLRISAQGGVTLLLAGCTPGVLGKKDNVNFSGSDIDSSIREFGPIDRTLGDHAAREFSGDRNNGQHNMLWNLPKYLADKKIEGPVEEAQVVIVGGGASGMFSAYSLRQYKPIILEQADRFGGNAKGQSWRGIDFSTGSAYIDLPHHGSPMEEYYRDLDLDEILVQRKKADPVEYNGKLNYNFWDGETDPNEQATYQKIGQFFNDLVAEKERPFPFIPSLNPEHLESLKYYDQWDLYSLLTQTAGGKLPTQLETAIEHYCWSTYAASAKELSAPAVLNFLVQEVNPICIAAGGNSKIVERVMKKVLSEIPQSNFRAKSIVLSVKVDGDSVLVVYENDHGHLRQIRAKCVVMACPKFVVARILNGIEPTRLEAIRRLKYRSYMTANLLINKKMQRGPYDVFMIGKGKTDLMNVKASQEKMNATDFVMANFAAPAADAAQANVLTFYRAFPADGMRAELNKPSAYDLYRKRFEDQIDKSILPLMNLKSSDIVDLRLTLWGHALPLSAKGLYRGDTVEKLRKPFHDRVFFVEQDNWAYPSLQTGATDVALMKNAIIRLL